MSAQKAAEVLHAVREERQRRGVDTRKLILINIPRPLGSGTGLSTIRAARGG